MATNELKAQIKKLAQKMEENTVLDYELQGYLKDKQRRDIFLSDAKHIIRPKKKYAYIDQGNSGRFMVQTGGADKGIVWGIKGYGQKGRYVGTVQQVIDKIEKNNQSLYKGVIDRSLKLRKKK